jgi:hypothetical protein
VSAQFLDGGYAAYALLWAYGAWVAANVALFLLGAWLVRPAHPHFNGFCARVPRAWAEALTGDELRAVLDHERGHARLGHVWVNLATLALLFWPAGPRRRALQELAADDCVRDPAALASALVKMSDHPFDLLRAVRLGRRVAAIAGPAGSRRPCARDGRVTPPTG